MARSPQQANAAGVKRDVAQGWWRAADGFWYPPQAQPGQLWMGEVRGPHGETPPGPGWWMANDYCWYPPEARPGELWEAPPSFRGIPAGLSGSGPSAAELHAVATPAGDRAARNAPATPAAVAGWKPRRDSKDEAALLTALGLMLIILGVVLLAGIRLQWPDASALIRLLAWVPVAAGSSLTLIGSMRYLGSPS